MQLRGKIAVKSWYVYTAGKLARGDTAHACTTSTRFKRLTASREARRTVLPRAPPRCTRDRVAGVAISPCLPRLSAKIRLPSNATRQQRTTAVKRVGALSDFFSPPSLIHLPLHATRQRFRGVTIGYIRRSRTGLEFALPWLGGLDELGMVGVGIG